MSDHLADQFGMTDGAPASDTTGSEADASSMYDGGGDSTYGMDGDMYDDAQADTEDAADTTTTDSSSDSSTTDTGSDAADAAGTGDNITMTYEGTSYDAGEATYDSDGDGAADTAVQDHGYQVEYYLDSDGDGQADELTITDAEGNLISHTENVEGTDTWEETPASDTSADDSTAQDAPQADSAGTSSEDDLGTTEPDTSSVSSDSEDSDSEDSDSDDSASSESDSSESDSADSEGSESDTSESDSSDDVASMPTPPDAPSADGSDSASSSDNESDSQISPPGEAGEAEPGDMTVIVDGQPYDIGEPTHDITGDGTPDTVAVEKDGTVEYYVDTDQDGVVDQIVVLDESDGSLINHEVYDAESGTWSNVTEESAQGA